MKKNLLLVVGISLFAISCSTNRKITQERKEVDWHNYNIAGIGNDRAK